LAAAGGHVSAIEHNSTSFRYFLENAKLNDVHEQTDLYRADCRAVAPGISADRIVMGYYDATQPRADAPPADGDVPDPVSEYAYLDGALAALDPGGILHVHEATPENEVFDRPIGRIEDAAVDHDRAVEVLDRRRVKSYSEGVAHVVVDVRVS
jgi:tRNA wybutosine-synthesizing protein 2